LESPSPFFIKKYSFYFIFVSLFQSKKAFYKKKSKFYSNFGFFIFLKSEKKFTMEELKYPIGRFSAPEKIDAKQIKQWIREVQTLPNDLKKITAKLTDAQLDTPYRPEGWTVRQVVHHLADSHMNAFIRFKLAMTEENPTIKPYHEALWAELADGKSAPINTSVLLLNALHKRWVILLKSISKKDLSKRTFLHPETGRIFPLEFVLGLYSWHGKHHLAQIEGLIKRNNW
jgi:hypothetical protein